MPEENLYLYDVQGAKLELDAFDEKKGTYKAKVATLNVRNGNYRMLVSGVLAPDNGYLVGSDWNHSAGMGDAAPVAKVELYEESESMIANFQHDISDERSMASFRRVMFLREAIEFSLGYKVTEYTIDYEDECMKVYKALFKEATPTAFGASPDTKVVDSAGSRQDFDDWFSKELANGKPKEKEEEKKEITINDTNTLTLINELKRREFDFGLLV